jgi:hypothetical protein
MIINCHKINLGILIYILWVPKTIYFEMNLHVDIAFRVDYPPKVV